MSLYNMLFDVETGAPNLLAILNEKHAINPPRLRDCFYDGKYIVVHTRTGGGNREYYESLESCQSNYPEYFTGDESTWPTKDSGWNEDMYQYPWFDHDEDDDFDSTYANFYFLLPEEITSTLTAAEYTPAQKWELLLTALKSNTP